MQIRIEKIVQGGDALGRADDGRAVFIPFAAPGELVRADLAPAKGAFYRGALREVLEPAPDRVTPRCRHFMECGGCRFQHLAYPAQLRAKQDILAEQLARIGGIKDAPMQPIIPSPSEWHYRNSVQFAFAPGGGLGFHRLDGRTVMPIEECHLPEERLTDLWKRVDLEPVPGTGPERQRGITRVAFRGGDDGELIVLEGETDEIPDIEIEAPVSVALLAPEGEAVYLAGGPLVREVNGRNYRISAGSFFQINSGLAGKMVDLVLDLAAPAAGETALDLYAGTGLFSAFLAERVGRLVAVEESSSAVADFECNLDSFDNVELYAAPAEVALGGLSLRADLAVVDPPRAGMAPAALRALLRIGPPRIVMVSCDPATLARDARGLAAGGYRLASITPLDLFPQTSHLESISLWRKENAAS